LGRRHHERKVERSFEFETSVPKFLWEMISGGVGSTWTLYASALIGASLMFTSLIFGTEDAMADSDHLVRSLVMMVAISAWAQVARAALSKRAFRRVADTRALVARGRDALGGDRQRAGRLRAHPLEPAARKDPKPLRRLALLDLLAPRKELPGHVIPSGWGAGLLHRHVGNSACGTQI
jgi:hypothetical protein